MFLSIIVLGPNNPKHKIDELKHLWDVGVETYDVSQKQKFQMRVSLLWTISDFSAYLMLSRWSTAAKLAYPHCMEYSMLFHSQMVVRHHGSIIIEIFCLTITPSEKTRTALLK